MHIERETLEQCLSECHVMGEAHLAETQDFGLKYRFNGGKHEQLERDGLLRCYILRAHAGTMVGYAWWHLFDMPYSEERCANLMALYVHPRMRGRMLGARLLRESERQLQEEGVQLAVVCVTMGCDWSQLADRLGYRPFETAFAKRLDSPE